MQILFYQAGDLARRLEAVLVPHYHSQGISVSCHVLDKDELEQQIMSLFTTEAGLLFYSMADTPDLNALDGILVKQGLNMKRIAICGSYNEGIQAVENGSDFALPLPISRDNILRCCRFFRQKFDIPGKGTPVTPKPSFTEPIFEEYRLLMDLMHLGFSRHILDDKLTLLDANQYFYKIIGYTSEEIDDFFQKNGEKYFRSCPDTFESIRDELEGAQKMGLSNYEVACPLPIKTGKPLWFQMKVTFTGRTEMGFPEILIVYNNIDAQIAEQNLNKKLVERLSLFDDITKGYSITRFEREMTGIIQGKKPGAYSLLSMDMQHFKLVNELYGVEHGDHTLKYIHDEFRSILGENELIARVFSDNFVLLLKETDAEQIRRRLYSKIQDLHRFNRNLTKKYYFTFYAGLCVIDDPNLPFPSLLDRANIARKNAGQNVASQLLSLAVFQQEDRRRLLFEKELENRMESALKNHDFIVYLQPKVSLKNGEIEGAEALVRWNDPELGMILPGDFIPVFEKNGFITNVDMYVFEEVCRYIRKWLDEGKNPVVISVNLSRAHITDDTFLDAYEAIRVKYNVPVNYLELEMTETMILENPERLKKVLCKMHVLGYRCSMDDFGSGYSSLNIIKEMDFDVMKLDRAFFNMDAEVNQKEQDVISTVISLAGKLQMKSVAEGVETEQQIAFLKDTDCDLIQGYVYSRPLPLDEYEHMKYGMPIRKYQEHNNL